MKNRYFITFAYHGKNYCGWQKQPNGISVQEEMEKRLSMKAAHVIEMVAAGRTDAGVHAKAMTAHFDFEGELPLDFGYKMNAFLPDDISILTIFPVKAIAHARFSAISRSYEYHISIGKNPFLKDLSWHIYNSLDVEAMNKAASMLFQYNEFTSFSKLHSDNKTDICNIMKAEFEIREEGLVVFHIKADRFLRNMVRAITGTLVEVGQGKMTPEQFGEIIQKKDRSAASMSAPAHGLFFVSAEYPEDIL